MEREKGPNSPRKALKDALEGIKSGVDKTARAAIVLASLSAPGAHAQVLPIKNAPPAATEAVRVPGRVLVLNKVLFEPSPERTARKLQVQSTMKDTGLSKQAFETFISESLERTRKLWTGLVELNSRFEPVLSSAAVEKRVPGGDKAALELSERKNLPDMPGNNFEVIYHIKDKSGLTRPYVFRVTARHNLPADAEGWSHAPTADISAVFLRVAHVREDLPHFTGKRTTSSLIGELGTTTAPSQVTAELGEDNRPISGEILPIAKFLEHYKFNDVNMRARHSHMDFQRIVRSGGFCKVIPTWGVRDISAIRDANFYRSGAAELAVDPRTGKLDEVVGVQSFAWNLQIGDGEGGQVHALCYGGPEQLKLVLDEAAREAERKGLL